MGVLPLEFVAGTTRKTLNIDGTETFDVKGERTPRATLTLIITRKNGEVVDKQVGVAPKNTYTDKIDAAL